LAALAALEDDLFTRRFVVVDDDTMTFLWETATQVDARVRLDDATRTVAQGALWLEESLPPETLLTGLLAADRSRRPEMPCWTLRYQKKPSFSSAARQPSDVGGAGSSRLMSTWQQTETLSLLHKALCHVPNHHLQCWNFVAYQPG
jgi:CRISPR/Cas system CMR subunit Cmr4 (Cas7 group RAMP superfamily)